MIGLKQNQTAFFAATAMTLLVAISACSQDSTGPSGDDPALLSVFPAGGAAGVDPNVQIVIEFTHPMMQGMEQFADVHEGTVEGPLVSGTWGWNSSFTVLTFIPDAPLKPQTQYVVHIGGGMTDRNGQHLDYQHHGFGMGGQWMTQQMHLGGQHGYGTGHVGMAGQGGMGSGWTHPGNGGYGMIFIFTTA